MFLKLGDPDLTSLKFNLFQSIKRKGLTELFKIPPALHHLWILHVTAQIQRLKTSMMYKPRGELDCNNCDTVGHRAENVDLGGSSKYQCSLHGQNQRTGTHKKQPLVYCFIINLFYFPPNPFTGMSADSWDTDAPLALTCSCACIMCFLIAVN